jgi:hypothetical protein
MKYYIGSVSDYNGGTVRMLNTKNQLVPHVLGGANSKEDELTFISYEEKSINPEFLAKNNLRFLTENEVIHFMRGENLKGEKIAKPEAPKFSAEFLKEMIDDVKAEILERESNGENAEYFHDLLNRLNKMVAE